MAKKKQELSRFQESYDALKSKLYDQQLKIKDLQSKTHKKMSDNPLQTAAIAFGVGVICGIGLKTLIDSKRE